MGWIDLFIDRPVLTWMVTLSLVVFGVLGLNRLGIDAYPDMEFPQVMVGAELEGATPEVMEEDVTNVLEEYLNTIEGVKRMESRSRLGRASIGIEFVLGTDVNRAAEDVRDRVNRARRELPDELDPPIVSKMDMSGMPIMFVPLFTERTAVEATEFVDEFVKPKVETVSGVAGIEIFGELNRAIRIWIDGEALQARGLAATDVIAALKREHVERPGGLVEGGHVEYTVRTDAEYRTIEELAAMVIAYENGAPIRLGDVARVEDGAEDQRYYSRFDGRPGVGVGVTKSTDGNAVAVTGEVKDRLDAIAPLMPDDMKFKGREGMMDFTISIREAVSEAYFSLWFGALLATLTVFIFLRRFRPTLVVALAIPLSLVTTFGAMWVLDYTLNTMTILALTLAVGVVIDDAIVVLENIERHRDRGEEPREAASKGAKEIAFAATAATVSIAVVFLPVVFADGLVSSFLGAFGATVAAAVMVSLVVALTLTPMLAARIPAPEERSEDSIYRVFDRWIEGLESGYRSVLVWSVQHRAFTLVVAGVAFVAGIFMAGGLGTEFFPSGDEGRFYIKMETAPGTSPEGTLEILKQNEAWVLAQPEVTAIYAAAGYAGSSSGGEDPARGMLMVMLASKDDRERTSKEIIAAAREYMSAIPGQKLVISDMSGFSSGSDSSEFEVEIRGNLDLAELDAMADELLVALESAGGYVDLDKSLKLGRPELRVIPDREKAAALGVDADQLSSTVRAMIGGLDVGTFKEGGNRYDIRMRLDRGDRDDPSEILDLYARTRTGEVVELRNLVTIEKVAAPSTITRVDRQRAVRVSANLIGKDPGTALEETLAIGASILPDTVSLVPAGGTEEMMKSFDQLVFMQGLSILLIYMILAAQFESFVHPFTVMLALPLAMVGAFGGLALGGMTLNIFSMIGIILLFGLATKNSILLVDYTNQLRREGLDKIAAVTSAAPVRMRPVLMTALSMIFGVAPAALGIGPGSESRAPMAVAAGAGMISSTALTLLVVPVFYLVLDDGVDWLRSVFKRGPGPEPHPVADTGAA